MQIDLPKPDPDNLDEEPRGMWIIVTVFFVPWVLGLGVIGMFLLDLMGVGKW